MPVENTGATRVAPDINYSRPGELVSNYQDSQLSRQGTYKQTQALPGTSDPKLPTTYTTTQNGPHSVEMPIKTIDVTAETVPNRSLNQSSPYGQIQGQDTPRYSLPAAADDPHLPATQSRPTVRSPNGSSFTPDSVNIGQDVANTANTLAAADAQAQAQGKQTYGSGAEKLQRDIYRRMGLPQPEDLAKNLKPDFKPISGNPGVGRIPDWIKKFLPKDPLGPQPRGNPGKPQTNRDNKPTSNKKPVPPSMDPSRLKGKSKPYPPDRRDIKGGWGNTLYKIYCRTEGYNRHQFNDTGKAYYSYEGYTATIQGPVFSLDFGPSPALQEISSGYGETFITHGNPPIKAFLGAFPFNIGYSGVVNSITLTQIVREDGLPDVAPEIPNIDEPFTPGDFDIRAFGAPADQALPDMALNPSQAQPSPAPLNAPAKNPQPAAKPSPLKNPKANPDQRPARDPSPAPEAKPNLPPNLLPSDQPSTPNIPAPVPQSALNPGGNSGSSSSSNNAPSVESRTYPGTPITPNQLTSPNPDADPSLQKSPDPSTQERPPLEPPTPPTPTKPTEKKCDDPCIQKLQDKNDNDKPTQISVKVFKECDVEKQEPKFTTKTITVPKSEADNYKLLYERLANVEGMQCNPSNAVASVPEWWQIRAEGQRPQLVILFAEQLSTGKLTKSRWSLTVPHYDRPKGFKPSIPGYEKGNWEGILVLTDNSKIIVNASSASECKRVINRLKILIPAKYRTVDGKAIKAKVGERVNADLKKAKVIPVRADFYSTGARNLTPDWSINLRKK